jgi:hypothetical protein
MGRVWTSTIGSVLSLLGTTDPTQITLEALLAIDTLNGTAAVMTASNTRELT